MGGSFGCWTNGCAAAGVIVLLSGRECFCHNAFVSVSVSTSSDLSHVIVALSGSLTAARYSGSCKSSLISIARTFSSVIPEILSQANFVLKYWSTSRFCENRKTSFDAKILLKQA